VKACLGIEAKIADFFISFRSEHKAKVSDEWDRGTQALHPASD
jgi:hypothetical protein